VVHLAPADGAWSHVPDGFHGIRLVCAFIGVVSGESLSIYGCHHWQWLLL
jgi:hypothetical protein